MQEVRQLIEDIKGALAQNRWLAVTAAAVAGGLVLLMVVSCTVSHLPKRQVEQRPAETAMTAVDDGETEGPTTAVDASDATPTAEQQRLIDAYGDSERSLVKTLTQSVWTDNSGARVRFADTTYTDTDNSVHAYAISGVKVGEPQTETIRDNVAVEVTIQDTVFSIQTTDGKTYLCTYDLTQSANGTVRTIKDGPFAKGGLISETVSANEMEVDVPDELNAQIGDQRDALTAKLREWAGKNVPAASKATWDKSVSQDYANHTVTFGFTMNDARATKVSVTYGTTDKTFRVEEAR